MAPILENGDLIIVKTDFQEHEIKIGVICVADHPFISSKKVVKYIQDIDKDGRVFLKGANPQESTDSRSFGWIQREKIFAVMQSKI